MNRESERAALLRAILEQPDCDTVRGAFADWLDENGESERAEFIRFQLAPGYVCSWGDDQPRVKVGVGYETTSEQRFHLTLRIAGARCIGWGRNALVCYTFANNHEVISSRMDVRFERGFVCHIELPCADFMAHAADIFAAHPVTSVKLTDHNIDTHYRDKFIVRVNNVGLNQDGAATYLPVQFKSFLRGGRCHSDAYNDRSYDSADDARFWVSDACVNYGRALTSLPLYSPPVKAVRS